MLVPCRPSNVTVTTSINICSHKVDLPKPWSPPLWINVYYIQTTNRRYSQQGLKGRALKTPSCICSCQLCIKSEVCYGNCWKQRRVLEAMTGCWRGPHYDGKCSFYFNYYFFCTTPTSNKPRSQTESCLFSSTGVILIETGASMQPGSKIFDFFFNNVIVLALKRPKKYQI